MEIMYSARSHVGIVRDNNEDNLFVGGITLQPNTYSFSINGRADVPGIFAVCDGMGGEANGEIASLIMAETLAEIDAQTETIQPFIEKAHEAIDTEAKHRGARMGTTLALAIITKKKIRCFNIGDSRIYFLRKKIFSQVTNDHKLENTNKLTRCIGIGGAREAQEYSLPSKKCRILICSDGLSDMLSAREIENAMRCNKKTADAANSLLKEALEKGGKDNITLIITDT
ncbi:MAG: serine/threonine-protein phosphatase [Clostridiales bacterium]|jgi:protein phosphatase|nr:serine/threonine-protein phosphatase [Clostridiales bacterium]